MTLGKCPNPNLGILSCLQLWFDDSFLSSWSASVLLWGTRKCSISILVEEWILTIIAISEARLVRLMSITRYPFVLRRGCPSRRLLKMIWCRPWSCWEDASWLRSFCSLLKVFDCLLDQCLPARWYDLVDRGILDYSWLQSAPSTTPSYLSFNCGEWNRLVLLRLPGRGQCTIDLWKVAYMHSILECSSGAFATLHIRWGRIKCVYLIRVASECWNH